MLVFQKCYSDHAIFISKHASASAILAVYVDDILPICSYCADIC